MGAWDREWEQLEYRRGICPKMENKGVAEGGFNGDALVGGEAEEACTGQET